VAGQIMGRMGRRIFTNKLILVLIILLIVAVIGVVIYRMYSNTHFQFLIIANTGFSPVFLFRDWVKKGRGAHDNDRTREKIINKINCFMTGS